MLWRKQETSHSNGGENIISRFMEAGTGNEKFLFLLKEFKLFKLEASDLGS